MAPKTHFILTNVVDRPGMGSRDHGHAATHAEVEHFQGPVPAGGQHEVWEVRQGTPLSSARPAPHVGPTAGQSRWEVGSCGG